jgi:hypothetical protein
VRAVVTRPANKPLAAVFDKGGAVHVTRLYRRDDVPQDQCRLRAGLVPSVPLMRLTFHIRPAPGRGEAAALSRSLFSVEGSVGLRCWP